MTIKMGISGNKGSFSEAAAMRYIKQQKLDASLSYLLDMDTVLLHLNQHKIDLGLFPVINNNSGIVEQAFEAMGKHEFALIDSLVSPIEHCLMTLKSISADEITKIISHPQALAQCKNYLKNQFPKAKLVDWIDTAEAAKDLAEEKIGPHVAVIAPKLAAKIYGLKIQKKAIQDKNPNMTTFILVENIRKKLVGENDLDRFRKNINSIDAQLISLLSERRKMSLKIGKYKKENQMAVLDSKREHELLNRHKELANKNNLSEQYVEDIFKLILDFSKKEQES